MSAVSGELISRITARGGWGSPFPRPPVEEVREIITRGRRDSRDSQQVSRMQESSNAEFASGDLQSLGRWWIIVIALESPLHPHRPELSAGRILQLGWVGWALPPAFSARPLSLQGLAREYLGVEPYDPTGS